MQQHTSSIPLHLSHSLSLGDSAADRCIKATGATPTRTPPYPPSLLTKQSPFPLPLYSATPTPPLLGLSPFPAAPIARLLSLLHGLIGAVVHADVGEEVVCVCSTRWTCGGVDSEDDTRVGGVSGEVGGRSVAARSCWLQQRMTTMVVCVPSLPLPRLLFGLRVSGQRHASNDNDSGGSLPCAAAGHGPCAPAAGCALLGPDICLFRVVSAQAQPRQTCRATHRV